MFRFFTPNFEPYLKVGTIVVCDKINNICEENLCNRQYILGCFNSIFFTGLLYRIKNIKLKDISNISFIFKLTFLFTLNFAKFYRKCMKLKLGKSLYLLTPFKTCMLTFMPVFTVLKGGYTLPLFYWYILFAYIGICLFSTGYELRNTVINRETLVNDVLDTLIDFMEQEFMYYLKMSDVFLIIEYGFNACFHFTSIYLLNLQYVAYTAHISNDFYYGSLYFILEVFTIIMYGQFMPRFSRFREIKLISFETYFDIFLDKCFKATSIVFTLMHIQNNTVYVSDIQEFIISIITIFLFLFVLFTEAVLTVLHDYFVTADIIDTAENIGPLESLFTYL